MARSAKQIAAQKKASLASAAKRKNAAAYRDPRIAVAPKPHPNESAAGTKLYKLRRQFETAKPGSVKRQLHSQLVRARKEYWGS